MDTTVHGRISVDDLEPDREEVNQQCLMGTDTEAHPKATENAAISEDVGRDSCLLGLPDLDEDKGNEESESNHEQSNNTGIVPLSDVS